MLSRRSVVLGSAAILTDIRSLRAAEPVGRLQGFGMRTGAVAGLPLGNWPLDHTAVVGVSTGKQWGCFGRTAKDEPTSRLLSNAPGDELWADAIAGPDGSAGIELDVTGACQQCSNRILLPAGIDVDAGFGSEIATPIFGKFGFGITDFIRRIKDAAQEVNKNHPGRVSDKQVANAISRVNLNLEHEWDIILTFMERTFKAKLGPKWDACKTDLPHVYLALYNFREAAFSQYSKSHMTKPAFVDKMRTAAAGAIELVVDIIGPENMAKISTAPPNIQATFVFQGQ